MYFPVQAGILGMLKCGAYGSNRTDCQNATCNDSRSPFYLQFGRYVTHSHSAGPCIRRVFDAG